MKQCLKCHQIKNLTEFYCYKRSKDGYRSWCINCFNLDCKSRYENNPEPSIINASQWQKINKDKRRKSRIKYIYGISIEEYDKRLQQQNGVCAICKNPETVISSKNNKVKNLAIDHKHGTKIIRGLLCDNCNRGIGFLKDNSEYCKNAAIYLDKSTESVLELDNKVEESNEKN